MFPARCQRTNFQSLPIELNKAEMLRGNTRTLVYDINKYQLRCNKIFLIRKLKMTDEVKEALSI